MTEEEYLAFARPYDLKLLHALPPAKSNVLHVCRRHNYLRQLQDYPVQAFNWDSRGAGNLSLAEGRGMLGGKTVIGGLGHGKDLVEAAPKQLTGEVLGVQVSMGKSGWMLGPGCTFSPETPEINLLAVREAVEKDFSST